MARSFHRVIGTLGAAFITLIVGLPTPGRADGDSGPAAPALETEERPSVPTWVWLVPPAGLVLGLGLGARLRGRASRRKDG